MDNAIVQQQPQRLSFSAYIASPTGQKLIGNAISDRRKREAFATAIISAVASNPALQGCTAPSIISAALQGVAMGLAPSPQLGQFFLVPFRDKKTGTTKATFVPGYRGYIQLAYRSGLYVDLDARPVVEGEYLGLDKLTGRPRFEWIEDDTLREQLPVVGYMAYFELVNGARKVLYWSREKMIRHADRFSPAFSADATGGRYPKVSFDDYLAGNYPKSDEWKYSSFWYKDFDAMSVKTMLRQLITKWGPVSIDLESAIVQDAAAERDGVDFTVVEAAEEDPVAPVQAEQAEPISEEPQEEQVNLDEL